jgi:hypothetical protein
MPYTDKQRKTYWAIKNGLDNTDKKLIRFYELQWNLRTNVPTIEQMSKVLNLPQTEINHILGKRAVGKALDARGIPWRQHSQSELTATQVAAAIVMMTPDGRSSLQKLDELGIQQETYQAWLADPQFKNLVDNVADRNLKNVRPTAIAELTNKINAGDWQAIRYFLDATGEFVNTDTPQSEQLIRMLIEIIQKHVKDPAIIAAIAQDIKLASGNRTLEVVNPANTPHEIESYAVEDPELERAKNMLGIQ